MSFFVSASNQVDGIKKIGKYFYFLDSPSQGNGTFSTVYQGYLFNDMTKTVAIKVIRKESLIKYPIELFIEELNVYRQINVLLEEKGYHHLNFLTIYRTPSENIYIISEFCQD